MRAPEFWTGRSAAARACAAILSPLGALYGLSVRARRARAHPFRARARVVCIGNLTAGGTGKTPIAIALGHMLAARGKKIMFLTRGYGGRLSGPVTVDLGRHSAADTGDEALLLAAHATSIVAKNRAEGARLADKLGADIILMDDGFQNFQLVKDLSFVVVDAAVGFGNGRLIPAGPLREPVAQGLSRADAAVLVGDGAVKLAPFAGAILPARIVATAPDALGGQSVVAFAGIGRPEKFFAMLREMGVVVAAAQAFPDHHRFSTLELAALKRMAQATGALLVTTEKDFVRLDPEARKNILPVPVHAVFTNPAVLAPLLDRVVEAGNVARA